MKIVLWLILMSSVAFSCITQRKCLQRFPPVSDSIYIAKIDSVPIYIPGDTIQVSSPVNCPDQDLIQLENSKLKQTIRILNGKVLATTEIKPIVDTVYIPEIHEKITIIPKPEKYIPMLYKISLWMVAGMILLIVGYFALKKFF